MSIEAENEAFEAIVTGVAIEVGCEYHLHEEAGRTCGNAEWMMELWCPDCGQQDLALICEDAWKELVRNKEEEEMPCLSCGEVFTAFAMIDSLRRW